MKDGQLKKAKERLKTLQDSMIGKYGGRYEIIGREVISSLEEVYKGEVSQGEGKGQSEDDERRAKYRSVTDETIKKSKLTIRNSQK